MKALNYYTTILFVLAITCVISCKDDDDNTNGIDIESGRREHIVNLYDNSILPTVENHITATQTLLNQIEIFVDSLNETELNLAKNAWKTAFLEWKSLEDKNIGPIQTSFIHINIHQWPVSEDVIENIITSQSTFNSDAINLLGANSRGYAAIEYLLFNKSSKDVLESFTTNTMAANRKSFLVALAKNLLDKSEELKSKWESYEEDFKNNLETGVDGSQNRVVNSVIAQLETINNKKLNPVLDSSPVNPTLLEAFRSEESKAALEENIMTLYNDYKGAQDGLSYFSLSQYISITLQLPDLDNEVKEAFETAIIKIQNVPNTLESSVTKNSSELEQFRIAITDLVRFFKTDISSAANIVVTFNDNDGD